MLDLSPYLQESYRRKYGVSRFVLKSGSLVALVSAKSWSQFLSFLPKVGDRTTVALSPELITVAGMPLDSLEEKAEEIEGRIEQVVFFSTSFPRTTFVLGTPTFSPFGAVRNSCVFIKDGKIFGKTHKRSGATPKERSAFCLVAEEPPALICGNMGVVICADLPTAGLFARPHNVCERTLELSGRENLIGKSPVFIHPKARTLLVSTCWGVGGVPLAVERYGAERYYLVQLRNTIFHIFQEYPSLEEILVSDRILEFSGDLARLTPKKPYNAYFSRK